MARVILFFLALGLSSTGWSGELDLPNAEAKIAIQLFESQLRLAQDGSPEAMYALAGMYEEGFGTPLDYPRALHWYRTAAALGYEKAGIRLNLLREMKSKANPYASTTGKPPAQNAKSPGSTPNDAAARSTTEILLKQQQMLDAARAEAEQRAALLQKQLEAEREAADQARKEAEDAKRQQEILAQEKATLRATENAKLEADRALQARKDLSQINKDPTRDPGARQRSAEAPAANVASSRSGDPSKQNPKPAEASSAPENSVFQSNPCNGPAARFMSTCR